MAMSGNSFWPSVAGAGGMFGAGLGSLFGNYTNPAQSAMPYMQQGQSALEKYLSPYIQQGSQMGGMLQGQYGSLMNDPGGMINKIGQGYQQSPGFQFQLQQALKGANQSAAAGGMAGSPMSQQQNMGIATNLANQNYNQWLQNAMGMYGEGLQGAQGMYGIGAQAGMGMGQDLASLLASQGQLAYEGQNAQNQHEQGGWGALLGGAGSLGALAAFSSSALKDRVSTPSTKEILDNIKELSLDRWKYKGIDQTFIGPYAEEFSDRFGVGDGKTINMIDAIGVLFGAIKALSNKIEILEGK